MIARIWLAPLAAMLVAACHEIGHREVVPFTVPLLASPPDERGGPEVVQSAAPAGGMPLGVARSDLGGQLDQRDLELMGRAQFEALEHARPGAPVTWRNPRTGRWGEAVPGAPYLVNERECRDLTHIVAIGDRQERLHGTACRQADGGWRPIV